MGNNNKLTLNQVERIEAELAKPQAKRADVAKKFGLSIMTVEKMDNLRKKHGHRIEVTAVRKKY
jgi:hypothetical protein